MRDHNSLSVEIRCNLCQFVISYNVFALFVVLKLPFYSVQITWILFEWSATHKTKNKATTSDTCFILNRIFKVFLEQINIFSHLLISKCGNDNQVGEKHFIFFLSCFFPSFIRFAKKKKNSSHTASQMSWINHI